MPGLYDLTTLLDVVRVQKVSAPQFWINYFSRQINFETPTISFDKVYDDGRAIAPFVAPNVQGRPQKLLGYETVQFAPAYSKIKDVVSPEMHIERQAGEALGTGSLSIEQRRQAVIGELLARHKTKHRNLQEWLAAKAIIDGKVVIKGEDYPEVTVDFRRDPSLTAVLAGGALWSAAGTADPLGNIRTMRRNVNNLCGARTTTHIFGGDAWDALAARVDLKALMDKNYGGQESQVTLIKEGFEGMEYMGVIQGIGGAGRIEAWVNTSKYLDPDTGAEAFYLDQKTVVGVSEAVQGVRCFGAIRDKAAGYRPLEVFYKNFENDDPSVEYLLSQSAPLMVPKQPNASYSIKVLT